MIERYTRKQMGELWAPETRFSYMLRVEVAVARAQAGLGIIPKKAALEIAKKAKFQVPRILELERTLKHDVISFVTNMAENVGENGRYIHFGMTSSDVLDTALSLQFQEAGQILLEEAQELETVLRKSIKKYKKTICAGRTHGMHAEPTTFGFKLAGYYFELQRNIGRFTRALENVKICKLSGAVGTYSTQSSEVERRVAKDLGLKTELLATQVIPRDRHAELVLALSFIGSGLERLAVELRHLQRTEVAEVIEGFTPGQKGSSAMPHKKNPISAENISGLSRLLRGYAVAALENIPLWHERDISHSSVERVIFADAFIVCDYALHRMKELMLGLFVDEVRMKQNMDFSQGMLFSSHALLHLVEKGFSREDAYKEIQRLSHSMRPGKVFGEGGESAQHLKAQIANDPQVGKYFSSRDLEKIFSGATHQKSIHGHLKKLKLI